MQQDSEQDHEEVKSTPMGISQEFMDIYKDFDSKAVYVTHNKIRKTKPIAHNYKQIILNIISSDFEVLEEAKKVCQKRIISESAKHINHVTRIIFQASCNLKRPYDVNMLSQLLNIKPAVVGAALKKNYQGFVNPSDLTELDFLPTYLWILNIDPKQHLAQVEKFLRFVNPYDGRSIYAIARDFVIIYAKEILQIDVESCKNEFLSSIKRFVPRALMEKKKMLELNKFNKVSDFLS